MVQIEEGITRFGRHPSCDLQLDGTEISRKHGRITILNGEAVIQDQGSQNGTYVNGERVRTLRLSEGDICRVGEFRLSFSWKRPSAKPVFTALPGPPPAERPQLSGLRPTHPTLKRPQANRPNQLMLLQLAQALFSAPNLTQGAARAIGLAVDLFEASAGALFSVEGGALKVLADHGRGHPNPEVRDAAARWAAERQTELRIDRVAQDPRFQHLEIEPDLSLLVLPLAQRRQPGAPPSPVSGVLLLERMTRPFEPAELDAAMALGQLLTLAAPAAAQPPEAAQNSAALCSPALLRRYAPPGAAPQLQLKMEEATWLIVELTGLHGALAEHSAPTTASLNRFASDLIRRAEDVGGVVHAGLDGRWTALFGTDRGDAQRAANLALSVGRQLKGALEAHPQLEGLGWRAALGQGMGWHGGAGGPRGWRYLNLSPTHRALTRMLDENRGGGLWISAELAELLKRQLRLQPVRLPGSSGVFRCLND